MDVINDAQLDFERLKRTAMTLSGCGIDASRLRNSFSTIESYLNRMLEDWRSYRGEMVKSASQLHLTSGRLVRLDAFVNQGVGKVAAGGVLGGGAGDTPV